MSVVLDIPEEISEKVRQQCTYNPDTGEIIRTSHMGENRGTSSDGYLCFQFWHETHHYPIRAHRVAWFLYYDEWTTDGIDHINRDKKDNRIANLRIVSQAANNRNTGLYAHNTSGKKGVYKHSTNSKWVVQTSYKNRPLYLTSCDSVEEGS